MPLISEMWLLLASVAFCLKATAAQECGPLFSRVSRQENLDALANNCTILKGIEISRDFTGQFILPNITRITFGIVAAGGEYDDPIPISSFEMPDLEHVGYIDLETLTRLEKWSAPKLLSVEWISLNVHSHLDRLEFPALRQVEKVRVRGNFTEVLFGVLETVDEAITIANIGLEDPSRAPETVMDIALPVLEQVPCLSISGRASTISLPQLRSLGPTESSPPLVADWTYFDQDGAPIPLDLPKLQVVNGSITFRGNFSALSLPLLRNVSDNFWVEADTDLSIDLPLESAGDLSFRGNIESINLHNLRNWTTFTVSSDVRLDCNELLQKFDDPDRDINGGLRGELSCDSLQTSEERAEGATGRGSESDDAGSSMRGAIVTVLTGFSVAAALSGMLF